MLDSHVLSFYHLFMYYIRLPYNCKPEHRPHSNYFWLLLVVTKVEILMLSAFAIVLVFTMAKICTISDDSDTSGDQEDTEYVEASQGAKASRSEHHPAVPQTSRGESVSRLGLVGNE